MKALSMVLMAAFLSAGGPSAPLASEGFVTADDGAKLYYSISGTGSDTVLAPAAVYLLRDFEPLARGRTIVFYDGRSRGNSEFISDSTRLGLGKDVADLEAVRRALKIGKMAVIGWSYLGAVVALYASEHPEHVTRVIQIGPIAAHSADWPDTRGITRQIDSAALRRLPQLRAGARTSADSLEYCHLDLRARTLPPVMADTGAIGRMKSDPCEASNERPERWRRTLRLAMKELNAGYDFRAQAGKVTAPVLIVWGDHDQSPEPTVREWLQTLPQARLVVLHRAGHLPWLERPDEFFTSVDTFLRGSWPAGAEAARK